jgi:hypothetical protein
MLRSNPAISLLRFLCSVCNRLIDCQLPEQRKNYAFAISVLNLYFKPSRRGDLPSGRKRLPSGPVWSKLGYTRAIALDECPTTVSLIPNIAAGVFAQLVVDVFHLAPPVVGNSKRLPGVSDRFGFSLEWTNQAIVPRQHNPPEPPLASVREGLRNYLKAWPFGFGHPKLHFAHNICTEIH